MSAGPRGPRAALQKLARPGGSLGRIIDSTIWTLGERVLTLMVSFATSIVVANYLGVAAFGQLTYTFSLVTLVGTLVTAGLSGLVVRDLVRRPDERYAILGTVFAIRLVAGVLALAILVAVTFAFGAGASTPVLTTIVAIGLCFRAAEVFEFWFQSETKLRYVSIANITGTIVGAAVRLALVAGGGSIVHFAWAIAIEQVVTSLVLLLTYTRTVGPMRGWRFERPRAWVYLKQSWPLILSGVANSINLRVDQILLGNMLGSAAVGTYAVAARLSEVWYFVPTAVAGAAFPTVIRAKEHSEQLYRHRLRQLYGMFAWGAIGVAVVVTLAGGPLIRLLYADEFAGAADVLVVHVWTAPFIFMGVVFSKWLIIEGLLITSLVRHGFGAVLNIVLNILLIPDHGPVGSAVASLVSYAAATYGASFLSRSTRDAAIDMTIGLIYPLYLLRQVLARRPAG